MRKYLLLLLSMCLTFNVLCQASWTVQTVPNTRLESNEIHVSDPDGFLSDSAEMHINAALCAIRDHADVFVVTLASIGSDGPKHFATALFNYWGIGDAETNNGVLLLFVEDQHALEFETGYGVESTLTDAKCERIFTQTIVPYFRAGNYEGGLCAGVADIVTVFGGEVPMGLKSDLSAIGNSGNDGDIEDIGVFFGLFALFVFAAPFVGLYCWLKKRKKEKHSVSDNIKITHESGVTYIEGFGTSWSGSPWEGKGCLLGLMIGLSFFVFLFLVFMVVVTEFPDYEENIKVSYNWISLATLVLYLTWICYRQNHRALKMANTIANQSINPKSVYEVAFANSGNRIARWIAPWLGWVYHLVFKKKIEQTDECQCPTCQAKMKRDAGYALPDLHAFENRIEAFGFRAYRCYNGHVIVLKEKGKQYAKFSTCAQCGAYAMEKTDTENIRAADYKQDGESIETYTCLHCGHVFKKTVVIPKLVRYYSGGSSSSGSSYSSSSSSRSSGGSFGGGRSGGGGYSGRW